MVFLLVFWGSMLPSWCLSSFSSTLYVLILTLFLNAGSVHLFNRSRKTGSLSDPSNYRPIALTCILSKIFETLLNSHFLDHLESHSLLSDHQYGFRRLRSTGDMLSYLINLWSSALRDFEESCVVALDTNPSLLTGYGMRRCSLSSLPLSFLLLFACSCLVFSQIVPFRHL